MKKFDVIVVTTTAHEFGPPHVIGAPLVLPNAPFGSVRVAVPPPFDGVTSWLLGPNGAQSPGPVSMRPSFAHTATFSVVSETGKPLKPTVAEPPAAYGPADSVIAGFG